MKLFFYIVLFVFFSWMAQVSTVEPQGEAKVQESLSQNPKLSQF